MHIGPIAHIMNATWSIMSVLAYHLVKLDILTSLIE